MPEPSAERCIICSSPIKTDRRMIPCDAEWHDAPQPAPRIVWPEGVQPLVPVQPAPGGRFEHALAGYTVGVIRDEATERYWLSELRAAHAAEVEEAEQRGYAHGSEVEQTIVAEAHAAGLAEGRRQAFTDVIQNVRNGLDGDAFMSWLEARAGGETK